MINILSAKDALEIVNINKTDMKSSELDSNEFEVLLTLMETIQYLSEHGLSFINTYNNDHKHLAQLLTKFPNVIIYLTERLGYNVRKHNLADGHYEIFWH